MIFNVLIKYSEIFGYFIVRCIHSYKIEKNFNINYIEICNTLCSIYLLDKKFNLLLKYQLTSFFRKLR